MYSLLYVKSLVTNYCTINTKFKHFKTCQEDVSIACMMYSSSTFQINFFFSICDFIDYCIYLFPFFNHFHEPEKLISLKTMATDIPFWNQTIYILSSFLVSKILKWCILVMTCNQYAANMVGSADLRREHVFLSPPSRLPKPSNIHKSRLELHFYPLLKEECQFMCI